MADDTTFPHVRQVVLDTTDARRLAEFYRRLVGFEYRRGDEPPPPGQPDERGRDWLVLRNPSGGMGLAFQQATELRTTTWPSNEVPQQLHLDMSVPTLAEFETQHSRAVDLGARLLFDRSDHEEEPLRVYADPDGHPFCIFVASS
jgi:catechol 2,3-dioxygenase-like lactoylglutathione lyase family enzyme